DPPVDSLHPARMEVLHIPSGDVAINGVAYLPTGPGPHPVVVLLHGYPGNEKNLDLAQAIRRAGWSVITFNYRGSWGSLGQFRFGQNLEDADAVLAFLHDTSTVRALDINPDQIVMAGHSMGGWVTALTAAHHPELKGAILISAADMGKVGTLPRKQLIGLTATSMEALAGVTAESMADDLIAGSARWTFEGAAPRLGSLPLLVMTANDGLAPHVAPLVATARAKGNTAVATVHAATDHSWSDTRILLESTIINWLEDVRGSW
ncbi:MAG: alpha/beta fold hydrolase, partial [Gemmatimonadota bacterium]